MKVLKSIWVACLVAVAADGAENYVCDGRPGYGIITADLNRSLITKFNADGEAVWTYEKVKCIDVWALRDGNVLTSYLPSKQTLGKGGVRLIGPDKETLFDYSEPEEEFMGVQPLDNGNFLMAECHKGLVTEMNLKGERIRSFNVKTKPSGHKTMRRIRLTPRGTVVVNECYTHKLREYEMDGTLVSEVDLMLNCGSQPQPNGNTLVSCWVPHKAQIVELDPAGNIVWQIKPAELPKEMAVVNFSEAIRLPNGNILTGASCKHSKAEGPRAMLFELTPDKKVVWQIRDVKGTSQVTTIKPVPSWPAAVAEDSARR